MIHLSWFLVILVALIFSSCSAQTSESAPDSTDHPDSPQFYIENKGSDTMVNLALAWAEAYQSSHPEVQISVTGGGTVTGIAALINNSVDLTNASRAIKSEEIEKAEQNGVMPAETSPIPWSWLECAIKCDFLPQ